MPNPDEEWKDQAPKASQVGRRPQKNDQSWGNWLSQKAQQAKAAVDESGYVELAQQKAQAVKESVGPALTHAVSQLEVATPYSWLQQTKRATMCGSRTGDSLTPRRTFFLSAGAQQRARSPVEGGSGAGPAAAATEALRSPDGLDGAQPEWCSGDS